MSLATWEVTAPGQQPRGGEELSTTARIPGEAGTQETEAEAGFLLAGCPSIGESSPSILAETLSPWGKFLHLPVLLAVRRGLRELRECGSKERGDSPT